MLVLDTSRSMAATDVTPSRFTAATTWKLAVIPRYDCVQCGASGT